MNKPLTKNVLMSEGIIKNEEKLRSDYANYLENYVCRKSDNVKGFDRITNELNKDISINNFLNNKLKVLRELLIK